MNCILIIKNKTLYCSVDDICKSFEMINGKWTVNDVTALNTSFSSKILGMNRILIIKNKILYCSVDNICKSFETINGKWTVNDVTAMIC